MRPNFLTFIILASRCKNLVNTATTYQKTVFQSFYFAILSTRNLNGVV
jgi:hypothetical protein